MRKKQKRVKGKVLLAGMLVLAAVSSCGCGKENAVSGNQNKDTDITWSRQEEKIEGILESEIVQTPVSFLNNTGIDIYYLYASEADTDDWEEDLMEQDVLQQGQCIWVDFTYTTDSTIWDFAVEDDSGNLLQFYDLDFGKYGNDGVTIVLNNDGTANLIEGAENYRSVQDELEKANNEWKQYFIDYIQQKEDYHYQGEYAEYALICVTDDDIPELYVMYESTALGQEVAMWTKDKPYIITASLPLGEFAYLEKGGKFFGGGRITEPYEDVVYRAEQQGYPFECIYTWEYNTIGENEAELRRVFDKRMAKTISYQELYSADEIIAQINQW